MAKGTGVREAEVEIEVRTPSGRPMTAIAIGMLKSEAECAWIDERRAAYAELEVRRGHMRRG